MRRFVFIRESLQTIELTEKRLVLRERPHYFVATLFVAMGVLALGLAAHARAKFEGPQNSVVFSVCALFLSLALYGSTESTISMDSRSDVLDVKRRFGPFVFAKRYPVREISRVFEWKTRKGNALKLQLSTGKKRNLTLFAEYSHLSDQARLLNRLVMEAQNTPPARI
jgi:hypothetical protein